ncbi:MAG: aldehyde dehydrogenase family protein [Candidatus Helarchaeota archaeon]
METEDLGTIPLVYGGEAYYSQKTMSIKDFRGNHLCELCVAPSTKIAITRKKSRTIGFEALQKMDVLEVIELYHETSKVYKRRVPISPDISLNRREFAHLLSISTGLPVKSVSESIELVQKCFQRNNIFRILEAGSPTGDASIYDTFIGERAGTKYVFAPRGKNVGVILPSNHPTVPIVALFIPAYKIPVILRPSRKEPFSSLRMANAFCEAGAPDFSISYLITGHEDVHDFLTKADLGMFFGNYDTVARYRKYPTIKCYGPGNSKILIDREFLDEHYGFCIDVAYKSIMDMAGRGCINISDIVFVNKKENGKGQTFGFMEFVDDLCLLLNEANILDPLHPHSDVGAIDPMMAEFSVDYIRTHVSMNDIDYTSYIRNNRQIVPVREDDLIVKLDGATFLRPTLIYLSNYKNPLFNIELAFQFAKAVEIPYENVVEACEETLSLTFLSEDHDLLRKFLQEPSISKVYLGATTFDIDPAQPHEGFLAEHLYKFKAVRNAKKTWFRKGEIAAPKPYHKWKLLKKTHKREEAIVK